MLALNHKPEAIMRQAAKNSAKNTKRYYEYLLEQSRFSEKHFRQLARQILLKHEKERRAISRELYEGIAQTLAGVNLYLETLKSSESSAAIKKIAGAQKLIERSLKSILRFARTLRPDVLDNLGLFPALHAFAKDFTKHTGIVAHFHVIAEAEKMNNVKRTAFYRVAQGALANVAQHAEADRVDITIKKKARYAVMEITDNGKAFKVSAVKVKKSSRHLSLYGMKEIVEMAGGHFKIKSIKGRGTTVRAEIPLI